MSIFLSLFGRQAREQRPFPRGWSLRPGNPWVQLLLTLPTIVVTGRRWRGNAMTPTRTHENGAAALREQLSARLVELRAKLASERVADPDTSAEVAGEVRDAGDESVAIERTDVRTALMERAAREMSDLQSALQRLEGGSYGICVECSFDIEAARLRALPTARRCSACQEVFEHRAALTAGR
jgi:DnaK suppressor protein